MIFLRRPVAFSIILEFWHQSFKFNLLQKPEWRMQEHRNCRYTDETWQTQPFPFLPIFFCRTLNRKKLAKCLNVQLSNNFYLNSVLGYFVTHDACHTVSRFGSDHIAWTPKSGLVCKKLSLETMLYEKGNRRTTPTRSTHVWNER